MCACAIVWRCSHTCSDCAPTSFWLTGTLVGSLMAAPALAAPSTTAWAVFPTIAGLLLPAAVLLGTVLRYPLILGKFMYVPALAYS